ncbi:MAG: hypothetical protein ACK4IY_01930 [Chitinophagales bacterium]
MKKSITIIIIATITTWISSCKNVDEPEPPDNPELITTVELQFTNTANSTDVRTFAFRDPDGPGGNAPIQFDTIQLDNNTVWDLVITLLDESESPAENITEEVEEEGDEHQFFFTVSASLNLTVNYNDADINGDPIGIINIVNTGDASSGNFTVILKHQPGTKDGNITTGDTDVEVVFETIIAL